MTTYTKSTITTYQLQIGQFPEEWLTDIIAKTEELMLAGKTDGVYDFMDAHTVRRKWIDQAATDEWIAFFVTCCEQHGVVVNDIQIVDYSDSDTP
jgi:hypothetical protein